MIVSIILAHLLLFISFVFQPVSFWLSFSISLLILSAYSFVYIKMDIMGAWVKNIVIGLLSGIGLYGVFFIGKWLMEMWFPSLMVQLEGLYSVVQPIELWHYIVLFLIVIPGEEFFWRGYVLKRLTIKYSTWAAVVLSVLLYASANLYAGSILLILATLLAGSVWSLIYLYTKNIWAVILSHIIFDLLLLIIFPVL